VLDHAAADFEVTDRRLMIEQSARAAARRSQDESAPPAAW